MKLFIIAFLFFGPAIVTSDKVVRFIFNGGDPLACNTTDSETIADIFNPLGRRQLRTSIKAQQRDLGTRTASCSANCKYSANFCHYWGLCRRRELSDQNGAERDLLANSTCTEQINEFHTKLDNLISTEAVSPTCMAVISSPNREASCYDDVIYGQIDSVQLWNLTASRFKPVSVKNDMSNTETTICDSMLFTIEANVNTCVDYVHFSLVGPGGIRNITEDNVPYVLFGNTNKDILYGKKLNVTGSYTLTIVPDKDLSKAKIVKFNVEAC